MKGKILQFSYYRTIVFLVCLFPLFFVFSFITIPGIGSPEKVLSLCILLGAGLVFYFQYKKFYFNKVIDLFFFLYLAAHFVSLFYSPAGISSNFAGILSHISMWVFVLVLANLVTDEKALRRCNVAMVVMTGLLFVLLAYLIVKFKNPLFYRNNLFDAVNASFGFLKYSILNNPNRLCRVLLMVYPFVLLLHLHARTRLGRTLTVVLFSLVPLMVFVTISRMGIITLMILLSFMWLWYGKKTKVFRYLLVGFLILAVVFTPYFVARFLKLGEEADRLGAPRRVITWEAAVGGWLDSPWFGSGAGKQAVLHQMGKHGAFQPVTGSPKAPHSAYLNTLVETGAIGFALLLLFFFFFCRYLVRARKYLQPGTYLYDFLQLGLLSLLSVALTGLTAISLWQNIVWYIIGLLYAAGRLSGQMHCQQLHKQQEKQVPFTV